MEGNNIIIVSLQSWDIEIGSNCKNIAIELAKKNRVLYVNRSLDFASILKSRKDNLTKSRWNDYLNNENDISQPLPNLWCLNPRTILLSVNSVPNLLFPIFNKINNKKIAKSILSAAEKLNFDKFILFIDNDFFRAQYLADFIKPEIAIYYIRDYLINQPYFHKHGPDAEKRLIRKSDLIVANSLYLTNYASVYNPKAYFIGQGCDFSNFELMCKSDIPQEFVGQSFPIIGYVGVLSSKRLDIDLISRLAQLLPECLIMLVGPEDEVFKKCKLHQIKNVIFTGAKSQLELPLYINNFDICINPQLINELTVGNYPRKIDEYLILGKPVVATSTAFMQYFEKHVFLCNNLDDYLQVIKKLIYKKEEESIKYDRISFAKSHSWENSVKLLNEYCETVLAEKINNA